MTEKSDLEIAFNTLKKKSTAYSQLWNYYDGQHPLVYSRERLKDVFSRLDARFTENWCAVVVDSVLERILLKQIVVNQNDAATEMLNRLVVDSELLLDANDAHLAMLVTGESYIIAWMDEGDATPTPITMIRVMCILSTIAATRA